MKPGIWVLFVVLVSTGPGAAYVRGETIHLPEVMTPAEQRTCGIPRLRPAERRALELWLTRYTARLKAFRWGPPRSQGDWGGTSPGSPRPGNPPPGAPVPGGPPPGQPPEGGPVPPTGSPGAPHHSAGARDPRPPVGADKPAGRAPGAGTAHSIDQVEPGGAVVILEDGSRWEIAASDQETTRLWLPATHVRLVMGGGGVSRFPCTLINTDDNEQAFARYLGRE